MSARLAELLAEVGREDDFAPEDHLSADQIAAYVLEALLDEDVEPVESHLARCSKCARQAQQLLEVSELLGAGELDERSRETGPRIAAAELDPAWTIRPKISTHRLWWLGGLAAAMLVALALWLAPARRGGPSEPDVPEPPAAPDLALQRMPTVHPPPKSPGSVEEPLSVSPAGVTAAPPSPVTKARHHDALDDSPGGDESDSASSSPGADAPAPAIVMAQAQGPNGPATIPPEPLASDGAIDESADSPPEVALEDGAGSENRGGLDDSQPGSEQPREASPIRAANDAPGDGWQPYFRDEDGRARAIRRPVEQNPDKDWLGLAFTNYTGPRTRLAVMRVFDNTGHDNPAEAPSPGGAGVPIGTIEGVLSASIFETHRFDLIERQRLESILAEQDFGVSARVSGPWSARQGSLLGATYIVQASVNEWSERKRRAVGSFRARAFRKGDSKPRAEVAMSFRVVDAATGLVLFSSTERATAGSWGVGLGGGGASAPIDYALRSCINKGVYKLAMWLEQRPWTGTVVKVDGKRVYVKGGSDQGLSAGLTLTALSRREEIVDPETSQILGAALEVVGSMVVTQVENSYSIATIVEGCQGLQKGDRVEHGPVRTPR